MGTWLLDFEGTTRKEARHYTEKRRSLVINSGPPEAETGLPAEPHASPSLGWA